MSQSLKKEAILNTAESLFYNHGFHAIGLKRILNESNVATMTLYNHFSSKDQLIEEVLKKRESQYWSYLDSSIEGKSGDPFLEVAKSHAKWLNENGENGCIFLRAIEEFSGTNNQIEFIAEATRTNYLSFFEILAKKSDILIMKTLLIKWLFYWKGQHQWLKLRARNMRGTKQSI